MTEPEPTLTTAEVASRLSVNRKTVQRWVTDRKLVPAYTLPSGAHRFRWSEVEEQLARMRRDSDEG